MHTTMISRAWEAILGVHSYQSTLGPCFTDRGDTGDGTTFSVCICIASALHEAMITIHVQACTEAHASLPNRLESLDNVLHKHLNLLPAVITLN